MKEKMKKYSKPVLKFILYFFIVLLVFLGLLLIQVAEWVPETFGDIPFEQVIFHMLAPVESTDTVNYVQSFIQECLPFPTILTLILVLLFIIQAQFSEKIRSKKGIIINAILVVCSVVSFGLGIQYCAISVNADDYIDGMLHPSTIYEDYYVNPQSVNYTFPEQKRNLIYIFLESMETTYEDIANGGAMENNLIPELTNLANNNLTFSGGNVANDGFNVLSGAGWTVAAMVGQTSGIPLNIPVDGNSYISEGNFLNGAYSIGEILEDNGYVNELLLGSDAEFGGRKYYFEQHGNYNIVDINEVKKRGWLEQDYYTWWGYEDVKLFEYAKNELTSLAANGQPFNFTMLTADTHFTGGYPCQECIDLWGDQYSNVISCSSRHVGEFISWIQQQPFYANTTIVIAGDHKSMDTTWFDSIEESGYQRKGYFTIINPAIAPVSNESRIISTVDLFPTTLASLGVTFDSNRLALGTNLFTDERTLAEIMGVEELDAQLQKHSNYYDKNVLYGIGKK